MEVNIEELHQEAVKFVKETMYRLNYPSDHPLMGYPNTSEAVLLEIFVILKVFLKNDDWIIAFLKKCRAMEHGKFSYEKYNQAINEVIWLYYLCLGLLKTNSISILRKIFDENHAVYDNGRKFEFSILLDDSGLVSNCLINSEVKTLTCDPFVKEDDLRVIDGQGLIKPFFHNMIKSRELNNEENLIILKASTHYNQVNKNVKKIINKARGNNVSGYDVFNIGVIFINGSTSYEEFYSYLFHKTKGVYKRLLSSNIDAFVLISMDAHNSLDLENIYSMGYIQTALINPTQRNEKICQALRIDNYMAYGTEIAEDVCKKGQRESGKYKILCRKGFLNIIPYETSEEEIDEYIQYLSSLEIRY